MSKLLPPLPVTATTETPHLCSKGHLYTEKTTTHYCQYCADHCPHEKLCCGHWVKPNGAYKCESCGECFGCCDDHFFCHACHETFDNEDKCHECSNCGSCCDCDESEHESDCECPRCNAVRENRLIGRQIGWVTRGINLTERRHYDYDPAIFKTINPAQVMCDFYLLQYLVTPPHFSQSTMFAEDTAAWEVYADTARTLLNELVERADPIFIQAVDMAVGGEIRHHGLMKNTDLLDGDRERAWGDWLGIRDQVGIDAVKDIAEMFRDGSMRAGYGGELWANCADVLYMRLSDQLTPEMFVDRVFNLQHNNGVVLNKITWGYHPIGLGADPGICRQIGNAHADRNPDLGMLAFAASESVRELLKSSWPARNRMLRNHGMEMQMFPRSRGRYSSTRWGYDSFIVSSHAGGMISGYAPAEETDEPVVHKAWKDAPVLDNSTDNCAYRHGIAGIGTHSNGSWYCTLPANHAYPQHVATEPHKTMDQHIVMKTWPVTARAWCSHADITFDDQVWKVGDKIGGRFAIEYGGRLCGTDGCDLTAHDTTRFPHAYLNDIGFSWFTIVATWMDGEKPPKKPKVKIKKNPMMDLPETASTSSQAYKDGSGNVTIANVGNGGGGGGGGSIPAYHNLEHYYNTDSQGQVFSGSTQGDVYLNDTIVADMKGATIKFALNEEAKKELEKFQKSAYTSTLSMKSLTEALKLSINDDKDLT